MKEFSGKVAVITGAASGIGRALAERAAQEGMRIVLADVAEPALVQTEAAMKAAGADVLAVLADVSKASDVEALAQRTLDAYGAVHLLCNNAGVGAGSTAWEATVNDWQWVLGVNLWGVIHGLRVFVPIMLQQGVEAHIVNTASIAGLMSFHISAPYHATKHAIVALSENLHCALAEQGSLVRVSVLCPGWVRTRIMESERNRPAELRDGPGETEMTPERAAAVEEYRQAAEAGISPDKVADCVFQAMREGRFYILTHPDTAPYVAARMEALLQGRNPLGPGDLLALQRG